MSFACELPLECYFTDVFFTQSTSKLFGCGNEYKVGLYTACRNYTTECDSGGCRSSALVRVW